MPVFLDAAAGAPLHPLAVAAWDAAAEDGWADPDRRYAPSRRARLLLDAAQESLAESLGVRADELRFTGNGATALHTAVLGALRANRGRGATVVHTAVEHSAVLNAARWHTDRGGSATSVPVDALGRVAAADVLTAAARPGVAAVAVQAANHEVGTRQPVDAIAAQLDPVIPLVADVTHCAGHDDLPPGAAVYAADARMWGGPSLGIVAVRTAARWESPWPPDERGATRLPGDVPLPALVAAAAALRAVQGQRAEEAQRCRQLIDRIRDQVARTVPDVEVLGDPVDRLPHIVTFSCLYVAGEALLDELDRRGFAVSSGSSCTASTLEPSHVLVAMGALTEGNVRVSLHPGVTAADVDGFLAALPPAVAAVRAAFGADGL